MSTTFLESVAGVSHNASKTILKICDRSNPLILELLDFSVDLLVLLVRNLHNWPLR